MSAFEQGSGVSVSWVHLIFIVFVGTVIALSALIILISIVLRMQNPHHRFNYDVIIKICGLVFIVALIFGVIGSM